MFNLFNVSKKQEKPLTNLTPEVAKRSLDELFLLTQQYRSSQSYRNLIDFIAKFRFYSPYNAMLVHMQMPGARFVRTPSQWLKDYDHTIKPGARALVILRPGGPVQFVFDVSDTQPLPDAKPLPLEVMNPFEMRGGRINGELDCLTRNAVRDGVSIFVQEAGTQRAGSITAVRTDRELPFQTSRFPQKHAFIPEKYELLLNRVHTSEAQFATAVHELGHLYCGHLGTDNPAWWPDRRGLGLQEREFEAESVSYLVCRRFGIDTPSEQYLDGYLAANQQVPDISLEAVLVSAKLIEEMSRKRMPIRKKKKQEGTD